MAMGAHAVDKPAVALELLAGEYELSVSAEAAFSAKRDMSGHLRLRDLGAGRRLFGSICHLYGWTDVDFRSLGAPIGKSDTPPDSRDPENPGVLIWEPSPAFANTMKSRKITQPPGAPVLLIGTVENKRATRGMQDGGGIGLFVESKQDQCLLGRWIPFGVVSGAEGHFRLCRSAVRPPNPALNPTGLRPAG